MAAAKKSESKYGPAAAKSVEREMKAMHRGTLRSGGSGAKVTNPKQAIAIALSEARRAGGKVPPPPPVAKKVAAKKTASKKAAAKKSVAKKAASA